MSWTSAPARTIFSIWSWFVFGVLLIIWVPLVGIVRLVTAPFDKGRYAAGCLFRKFAVVHQMLNPLWHFDVVGRRSPADPRRPYVVVANHESFVDILLISHLPFEMKWLSKAEFFKIPLVGWLMRMAGDIPLDRSSGRSAVQAMKQCRGSARQEGVGDDLPGGHTLGDRRAAGVQGRRLPPRRRHRRRSCRSRCTARATALRKHDWRFGVRDAEVYVLEPIETAGMTRATSPALRDRVRDDDRRQARRGRRAANAVACGVAAADAQPTRRSTRSEPVTDASRKRPLAIAGR